MIATEFLLDLLENHTKSTATTMIPPNIHSTLSGLRCIFALIIKAYVPPKSVDRRR